MKSRFICAVSAPNLWEDHHHLILSLRPVMGIQRAGYQTVQSAGKTHPPTHTHTYTHTQTHTHTQGSAQTHWKKSWCRWHIWSSMPQLRVSYGCWQGAKSQEERKYGEEKKSESVKMKVIHPGFSLFRLSLLFICLFIFFFQSVSMYNSIQKKNIRKKKTKKTTDPH